MDNKKCPKCGSENVYECSSETETIYRCDDCHHYFKDNEKPELTTAEMLLWLAKNITFQVNKYHIFVCRLAKCYYWNENGKTNCPMFENIFVENIDEAIKAAYDKARE